VRAALELYRCPAASGQVVNIGSGQEISVLELKTKIEQILGWAIPTRYCDQRPGDVRRHLADITSLKNLVEFEFQVSMDEGLNRTIEFYRKQADERRIGGR
jgi:nucleoside-diphosphate-sugar epimerase